MSGYFKHNTNHKNRLDVCVSRAAPFKRSPPRTPLLIAVAMFLVLCLDVTAAALYPSRSPNGTSPRQTWLHGGDKFGYDRLPDPVQPADPAVSSSASKLPTDSHAVTEKPTSNHSPSFSNTSTPRKRTTAPLSWTVAETDLKSPAHEQSNDTNSTNVDPDRITPSTPQKTVTAQLPWAAAKNDDTKTEDKLKVQQVLTTSSRPHVIGVTPESPLSNPDEKTDHRKIQHHLYSVHKHTQQHKPEIQLPEVKFDDNSNGDFNQREDAAQTRLNRHELLLQQELQQQQQLIQDQLRRYPEQEYINSPQDDEFQFFEEPHEDPENPRTQVRVFLESNESIITKLKLTTTTISSNISTSNSTSPSITSTSSSNKTVSSDGETVRVGSTHGPVSSSSGSVVALYNSSAPSSEAPWVIAPPVPPSSTTDPACGTCSCPRPGGIYLLDCAPQLRVKDDCGCCLVCLRSVHQTCGGIYQGFGKCAANLECVPLESADYQSTRYDLQGPHDGEPQASIKGTCQPKVTEVVDDPCRNVGCDTNIKYQCPLDSMLTTNTSVSTGGSTAAESCCKNWLACLCNMNLCEIPSCGPGFTPEMIHKGNGKPGNCCDQFECKRNEKCADTICEEIQDCPADSLKVSQELSKDGCCFGDPVCVCPSRDTCPPVECRLHFNIMVVQKATRKPGSCCDKFKCLSNKSESCYSDGITYQHNSEWKLDNCTKCKCDNRLIYCETQTCNSPQCSWMKTPEGECCPVCKGCMANGNLYKNNESWKEDDCVTCRCNEGIVECQTAMCSVPCLKPRRVPGQCCPVCESPPTSFVKTTPRIHGGIDGTMAPWRKTSCLSNGLYYKNGEMWNDGCRECYCKEGKELCSLIACSVPPCSNPIYRIGDCCPSCPGTEPISSKEILKQEICHGENGNEYVEGEVWELEKCTTCLCHHGIILCNTEMCPPHLCHFPVKVEGECCAFCPRNPDKPPRVPQKLLKHCLLDGKPAFKHGEVWRSNPCQSCTCRHGHIHCFSQTCLPLSCNQTVFRKGQCCPTCSVKEWSTSSPSLIDNKIRKPMNNKLINTEPDDDTSYIIVIAILVIIICGIFGLLCLLLFNKYRNQV